mmetsp:Transcript_61085/g.164167  ORF Transcript_61085/g.164167 Transcript_61085/m.164167 type:complete len:234 (-) Transcript_61085:3205-3906(-)
MSSTPQPTGTKAHAPRAKGSRPQRVTLKPVGLSTSCNIRRRAAMASATTAPSSLPSISCAAWPAASAASVGRPPEASVRSEKNQGHERPPASPAPGSRSSGPGAAHPRNRPRGGNAGDQKARSKAKTTLFSSPQPMRSIASSFHAGSSGSKRTSRAFRTPSGSVTSTISASISLPSRSTTEQLPPALPPDDEAAVPDVAASPPLAAAAELKSSSGWWWRITATSALNRISSSG